MKHVDQHYAKVESTMRKNNVGFFNTEVSSGNRPKFDDNNEYKSNKPITNETNYNVIMKKNNEIDNISVPNQPKSQGQNPNMHRSTNFSFSRTVKNSVTLNAKKSRHFNSNKSFEYSAYPDSKPLTGISTYHKEMLRKPGNKLSIKSTAKFNLISNQKIQPKRKIRMRSNDIIIEKQTRKFDQNKVTKKVKRDYKKILNYSNKVSANIITFSYTRYSAKIRSQR
jgi:hypothetical protein